MFGIKKKKKYLKTLSVGTANQHTRDQWVENKLISLANGLSLLDAGAGEQRYRAYCDHLNYTSQDFGEYQGGEGDALQEPAWDYGNLDIKSDITNIPVRDAQFDVVLCTEVLEHVFNPHDALKELDRVLRPGGAMLLTAPFCALTHFAPHFYQTGFSAHFFEEVAVRLNYKVEEIDYNGNYFEYIAQELRRLPSIMNRYAGSSNGKIEKKINDILLDLHVASEKDRGSCELLSFGIHAELRKK